MVKIFKNLSGVPQTIGFKNRTVTWLPFGKESLFAEEYQSEAFQLRKDLFKEVK